VAGSKTHKAEVERELGRKMVVGERGGEALRGEGHSHCDRDRGPSNSACIGVVAYLLLGLSSPSSLHEDLQRVVVVKEALLDSHAKVPSLVDGGQDAPTAAVARVLMLVGLLDVTEVQEVE